MSRNTRWARRTALSGAVVAAALTMVTGPASAATVDVTTTGDPGPGGTVSLRQAIASADPGSTIVVPAGTYILAGGELTIAKSLTITGAGSAATTVSGGNAGRVFSLQGGGATELSGLTVTGGRVVAPGGVAMGGGIRVEGISPLTLRGVRVIGNEVDVSGTSGAGGVGSGGGVGSDTNSSLTLIDSTVASNTVKARGAPGGVVKGGGIAVLGGGSLTLTDSAVDANTLDVTAGTGAPAGVASGGGVYVSFAPATLSRTAVTRSTAIAQNTGAAGGGSVSGGGVYAGGPLSLTNVTISENVADASAAAAGGRGGTARGGGLQLFGDTTILSTTVSGNRAVAPGAAQTGIQRAGNIASGGETETVTNSIITGGVAGVGTENCSAPLTSGGHNLESADQCGFGASGDLVTTDPLLGPLQNNGGPSLTHALPPASPAIDAGDSATCPATDQRGIPRPPGAGCDIGSFEVVDAAPVIFIPGILGSEIWCDPATRAGRLWPALGVDEQKLLLNGDGDTNASPDCPNAGPAQPEYTDPGHLLGPGDSGIAESLLGLDIYAKALDRMSEIVGAENFYVLPWDWRRDTAPSISRLDALVDQVIAETGRSKVQIVAHSYGGLLTLHYARDPARRAKLSRVTSVGSPYLGSPKSVFPLLTGTELPFESGLAVPFGGQDDLRTAATTMRGLYNLWPSELYGSFLSVEGRTPTPLDGVGMQGVVSGSGGFASIWLDSQARHVSTYDSFDIGALPWRMIVSGGVPTIRRIQFYPAAGDEPDRAGITLAPGDGTVPLRSQTLLASEGPAIPGVYSDLTRAELCASPHGGQMGDPDLYTLITPFIVGGGTIDPAAERACRAQRRVVFEAIDGELEFGVRTRGPTSSRRNAARAALSVADAEAAGLVEVVRLGRQTLILADPATPLQLTIEPRAGAALRLRILDVDGDVTTVTTPEITSGTPVTVSVEGGAGRIVPPAAPGAAPPPAAPAPANPAGPSRAAAGDTRAPTVRVTVKRVGRRFRVTITAKDASGIKQISFRFGKRGKPRRYRKPLLLTAAQVRRLRITAQDKRGNTSRDVTAKLPKGRSAGSRSGDSNP